MNSTTPRATDRDDWWRTAVIYQVYPRSFADSDGDGIGDLPGITHRLPALAELGVDAIWLSPFFTSPQADAGYDVADYCDVDPIFGTLADFDAMLATAHELGLRVLIDLVPNHSSSAHRWFQEALAAPAGSPERARYLFRDGKGALGQLPPNNWESVFGGGAWTRVTEPDGTPGQWYLHLFDSSQPDFDWTNPEVREYFRGVLRFWLDRGVDGFRVDVAHGLAKAPGLPDYTPPAVDGGSMGGNETDAPFWAQDGVHEIYRDWHAVLAAYGPGRILAGEAWVEPLAKLANWVRPDEMHQTFNFSYLETPWEADALRAVVDRSLAAFGGVGAPSTWVLSNHDVIRHATRLGLTPPPPQGQGLGPKSESHPDEVVGLRRARAATGFMLSLPGSSYLYQGEELGLPEVIDLPDEARQDPSFFRTGGKTYGRDGCRVPLPWEADAPGAGFGPTAESWLPQPVYWPSYARDAQQGVPESTLEFYRSALAARRAHGLGSGTVEWLPSEDPEVLVLRNGAVTVVANTGAGTTPLPAGRVVLASGPLGADRIPGDTTVWLVAD
ncbi:glycoside hydrolase family 13 protein [Protaetiibacter larvae]|uniref:glycoside hydrolase family 13 protein n=1 Tax=Protaetiibacter larvae TaxID=2592654 RepID=UPI001FEA477A|nr:glycoside hydrolase family 13 protein [Protaetiibacter larvae]